MLEHLILRPGPPTLARWSRALAASLANRAITWCCRRQVGRRGGAGGRIRASRSGSNQTSSEPAEIDGGRESNRTPTGGRRVVNRHVAAPAALLVAND